MILRSFLVTWIGSTLVFGAALRPGAEPGRTVLVGLEPGGRLRYPAYSAGGDTLPDFSHCGFGGGGVALPVAPVRERLTPQPGGDDAPRIQAALDRVGALPPGEDGLRGAVLLSRGEYRCEQPLRIEASGVVLRGEGEGTEGTVVVASYRQQLPLIRVGGKSGPRELGGRQRTIADAYVPVGARRFMVEDAAGLAVGQSVLVVRRGNAAWITELGMDRIVPRKSDPGSTRQWGPFDLKFDRVITAIDGRAVTIDAPMACAIDRRWGGGVVAPYQDEARIERCGVEHLRAVSVFDRGQTALHQVEKVWVDERHATHLVSFGAVKHAWVRRLTTEGFYHGPVQVGGAAKWVTVEDCTSQAPVSQITGGRRYPFSVDGQLVLVQRCRSDRARHAFVFGARVPGPNVFLECVSTHDYASSEPHHRWSVGGLYDNVESLLAIQDRGSMGTGHGWAGANYVVWNCRGSLICQQPPTAQNFAIGFFGRRGKDAYPRPTGWWESEGTPVEPRSLYRAQLAARLGP